MGKRLSIEAQETTEELEQRCWAARDGVARSHWQIIWLLAGGVSSQEVAEVTGYSLPWIRELAKRYNTQGAAGIGDGRHHNPGHAPLLSAEQQQGLLRVLEGPSPEGGPVKRAAGAGLDCSIAPRSYTGVTQNVRGVTNLERLPRLSHPAGGPQGRRRASTAARLRDRTAWILSITARSRWRGA